MKVLLLGELSGVHEELRSGLESLGIHVTAAHSREAHPTYVSDVPLFRPPERAETLLVAARDIGSTFLHRKDLTGFDVVQIITPKVFNWRINLPTLKYLKQRNKRLVVITTSCTSDYHRRVRELEYSPCAECKAFDLKSDACIYDSLPEQSAEHAAFALADAIVATHYEYWHALQDTRFAPKLAKIPLPVDTNRHSPAIWDVGSKLRVWYGETRYGFKGGRSVHQALEVIKANHGDAVEVVKTGRLEFVDYLEFLETVDVVIDQANSYGPGMNALYALAKGRITMTGYEQETLDFVGAEDGPVINLKPDPLFIANKISELIDKKDRLGDLSRRSHEFVRQYHDSRVVAQQYINLYENLLP